MTTPAVLADRVRGGLTGLTRAVSGCGRRVGAAMRRCGRWTLRTVRRPGRVVVLLWVVGILMVGVNRAALADGIFAHPPYADTQPTLFEAHGPFAYGLTVMPDQAANSGLGLTAVLYQIVGIINDVLLWVGLVPLYGALTLLEWFLSLSVYRDAAGQIDTAVQGMAGQVFWPLITATAAVGVTVSFGKWQAEGRSPFGDLVWVIAATTLAVTFIGRPSTMMGDLDGVRQQMADAVVTGAAGAQPAAVSVTGYPNPTLGGPGGQVAARNLITGLWDDFGATPWCLAEFHELTICHQLGHHAVAGDDQWQQWTAVMADNGQVTEFGTWQNWVRGMDLGRLGYTLILDMLALPAAIMLLVLTFAGMSAVVGFMAMLLLAVLALVTWPIPGWFRRFGTQWWGWVLGFQLQALFITAILVAVMVTSRILGGLTGQYGFFLTGLLNLALLFWAVKIRGWIESTTVLGGTGSSGMIGYLALWGATKAAAATGRLVRGTARTALGWAGAGVTKAATSPRVLGWFRTTPHTPKPRPSRLVWLDDGPRELGPGHPGSGPGPSGRQLRPGGPGGAGPNRGGGGQRGPGGSGGGQRGPGGSGGRRGPDGSGEHGGPVGGPGGGARRGSGGVRNRAGGVTGGGGFRGGAAGGTPSGRRWGTAAGSNRWTRFRRTWPSTRLSRTAPTDPGRFTGTVVDAAPTPPTGPRNPAAGNTSRPATVRPTPRTRVDQHRDRTRGRGPGGRGPAGDPAAAPSTPLDDGPERPVMP